MVSRGPSMVANRPHMVARVARRATHGGPWASGGPVGIWGTLWAYVGLCGALWAPNKLHKSENSSQNLLDRRFPQQISKSGLAPQALWWHVGLGPLV